MMLWIWLGVIIVTAIIELVTIDLVSIWFTLGGIGALIAYALGLNQTIQIIIFIILSVICIGISRPLAKKYLRTQTVSTNYDRVIGQHGLVLKRIDADTRGEVKVLSMEWSASSVDNSTLEEGDYCEILAVEGAHLIIVSVIAFAIRIVPQSKAYVVERIGAYNRTCSVGLHILVPFLDRVANKVSLKEQVVDFAPQPVITKDNVTMQIDTVVYYQITDPRLFTYGVDRPINAIENLTATTLRNIIGDLELDETLTSRDIINSRMRSILDEATDPWGIKVHRVEVKNIIPPRDIQEAMEKQMRAERERREAILQAEGKKTAAILNAEGDKQSTILRAEAEKEAAIAKAEGQAEALRLVYEAQAKGITYINDAHPDQAYVTLQGFKALENLSKGDATKIIIPSELQGIAGLATTLKEVVTEKKDKE